MSERGTEKKQVVCYGEALWDILPTKMISGGAPANVAYHLHKLGIDSKLISRVGNDELGIKLTEHLKSFGLDVSFIQTDEMLPTSTVQVKLDKLKNASYSIVEDVAWDNITITGEVLGIVSKSEIIVYGSLASRFEKTQDTLFQILDNSNVLKVMDVNLRVPYDSQDIVNPLLHKANVVKLNEEELCIIAQWNDVHMDSLKDLMAWFANFFNCYMVCVTKGTKGASLLSNGEFVSHPGFKIVAVDSVGAGDAFLAGMISAIVEKKSPRESILLASAIGAFVASKEGATPELDFHEINTIINKPLVAVNYSESMPFSHKMVRDN